MTQFSARNIPTLFGVEFLSFPPNTAKNCFGRILTTFRARAPPEQDKLKMMPIWLSLAPETNQHCLGWNSCRLPSIWSKNVSVEFWRLFWAWVQPEHAKLKIGSEWFGFGARNMLTLFRVQFLSFTIRSTKKCFSWILMTFLGLCTTRACKVEHQAQMTRFCIRNIPTLFGAQFSSFPVSTVEKIFGRILTTFRVRAPPK